MRYPNPSTALASILVDELSRSGVGLAVAGPGSRSTALVLALSNSSVELVMAIDERSAAFHALGSAKASGRLAAVITTSGTAVANLMPAVVEADMAGVPLIVVSSDRPPELRAVGANQAISQPGMFGDFVRASLDIGPAEVHPSAPRWWRSMVSQAVGVALGFSGRRGPVHLNVAFREPTLPISDDGRAADEPYPYDEGREGNRRWSETMVGTLPSGDLVERVADAMGRSRRGLIVAGGGIGVAPSIATLGRHLAWPILATAESGLRGGEGVIATGHHLVGRLEPELIVRFGSGGPSRRMVEMLSGPTPQVVVGPGWSDPGRMAELLVATDPEALAEALVETLSPGSMDDWAKWWFEADGAVTDAFAPELVRSLSEPAVAAATGSLGADILTVASSMPIRDVESYAFSAPPLVVNRGASGIDGFVSTALGAARSVSRPLALTGDLSLLHDANGFLVDPLPDCVFVVVDNGGGGIFSFLPQAEHVGEAFERLFATPHGRDLGHLAEFHGLAYHEVEGLDDIRPAVETGWAEGGCSLVVARTDRDENVAEHLRLGRVADEAVASVALPAT